MLGGGPSPIGGASPIGGMLPICGSLLSNANRPHAAIAASSATSDADLPITATIVARLQVVPRIGQGEERIEPNPPTTQIRCPSPQMSLKWFRLWVLVG